MVIYKTLFRVKDFSIGSLRSSSFKVLSKIYLGFWIAYNFLNFLGRNVHIFHHISISNATNYPMHHKKHIYDDHYLKFHLQSCHLCIVVNCIKLPLLNNWNHWESKDENQHLGVELQHLSTLKQRPIEVRSNEIQAKNNP